MTDVSKIKKGSKWYWSPGDKIVVCTQTADDTRCGPVFSDPETGHDVLRLPPDEYCQFDNYFRAISSEK